MATAMFGGLALYSLVRQNYIWVPLLLFLLILGVQHPHTGDDKFPMDRGRQLLGLVLGVVFLTCFSLVPIQL